MSAEAGQQHPLGIYYKVWVLLFVLSAFSYATDFLEEGVFPLVSDPSFHGS